MYIRSCWALQTATLLKWKASRQAEHVTLVSSLCVCVFLVDVLWHCSALACSRLWDRPVVWGAGSTPPALCLSTSRKKGDFAPAIVQIPGNLQSQSPPFVLGQQWLRPLQLGRDRQVLPGRSQWLYIIDVSHR